MRFWEGLIRCGFDPRRRTKPGSVCQPSYPFFFPRYKDRVGQRTIRRTIRRRQNGSSNVLLDGLNDPPYREGTSPFHSMQ